MDTQLRTSKHASRATLHAVHSLDRVVISVPDLDQAQTFCDTFGLDVRRADGRVDLYTHGHPQHWMSLFPGQERRKLQYLRFGCFAEDLEPLRERLKQQGIPSSAPHPLGDTQGFWVLHPDGYPVQIVVAPKSSPDTKSVPHARATPAPGQGAAPCRSQVKQVRPRRLAHVAFFTTSVAKAIAFYEALGLRVADRSGNIIVFLCGQHGSDHHMVALLETEAPGIHHTSWDVGSVDEVGLGMEQMTQAGYKQGWGVGRHVLGSNYFYYARTPWDSYAEYSFDIDYVPEGLDWPAGDFPPEDSFYVWGPVPPPEFVINGEAPAA